MLQRKPDIVQPLQQAMLKWVDIEQDDVARRSEKLTGLKINGQLKWLILACQSKTICRQFSNPKQ